MTTSENGWPIPGDIVPWDIVPGRTIRLADGPAGYVLAVHALWFHDNIELINEGVYDDWGDDPAPRNVRGSDVELSNHDSGTAIDLNATLHPRGSDDPLDGYSTSQIDTIRMRLHRYSLYVGMPHHSRPYNSSVGNYPIRWGYDYTSSPCDGMHFEINRPPSNPDIAALAKTLRYTVYGHTIKHNNPRNRWF